MNQAPKNILTCVFLLILICVHLSCNKSLLAEIPSYLEIHAFDYTGNQGNTIPYAINYQSTNITDAWVTMDGQFLGTFELPCKIPILCNHPESGTYSFDIYPGIKTNGIAASRLKYPFYEKFEIDTVLERNKSISLNPTTTYTKQAGFEFYDEGMFEEEKDVILINAHSDGPSPVFQNNVVYQGDKSIAINLDDYSDFHIRSTDSLQLKTSTTFLELNFKTDITLHIGIIIINEPYETKEELIQLYATDEWKKIYLDLTPLIIQGDSDSEFQIYFEGIRDNTTASNSVYLDNLKLVFHK